MTKRSTPTTQAADPISLNDKWEKQSGRVYITGSQALARLPMLQAERDQRAGLNTAGFISGYRGSPLGNFDKTLWQIRDYLSRYNIKFQPGVNEDLGATAVWGSQQVNLFEGAKYDGVFGLWYGKGPGVDRTGDVFKHANAFGTTPYGGVLAIAGDDHASKSSTLPHQSDYAFMDAMMPVLYPSGIQEMLDFGLYGWAMSRFSGCWVGMKALAEVMDSAISADINQQRLQILLPEDFDLPADGLNARWPDKPLQQEERLHRYKIRAAQAFCRTNRLDKIIIQPSAPRFGIVTTGKSYLDVLQALEDLGISHQQAADLGIRLYKVAMPWPLEPEGLYEFATDLDEILVIEEKRGLIEDQVKEQLYSWQDRRGQHPRIVGKRDEQGRELLTSLSELTPAMIARAIAARIAPFHSSDQITHRLNFLSNKKPSWNSPAPCWNAPHTSVPVARTTVQPLCRKAVVRSAASVVIIWPPGWTGAPTPLPRWEEKAQPGSASNPLPITTTFSRTSATAPTSTPACWRSVLRSQQAAISPTKCSTTMP